MIEKLSTDTITSMAGSLFDEIPPNMLDDLMGEVPFHSYQEDPVGFCVKELGETLTDDVKEMLVSLNENVITVAVSSNATGKAQPICTKVMTPGGEVEIGKIEPGDTVFGSGGQKIKVKAIHPQGKLATYEILFNDGTSVLCSEDHLWTARSSSDQSRGVPYRIYTTRQLSRSIKGHIHIPMCGAVEYDKRHLLIDPYVMGVLLGDGHLGDENCVITLTNSDLWIFTEMVSRVHDADPKIYNDARAVRIGFTTPPGQVNSFRDSIKQYGLLGKRSANKFIPDDYMMSDVEDRKLLLAGLMDTDGYICTRHSMSYCTVSSKLARQVQYLIWSLGGTAKIREKDAHYVKNGKRFPAQKAYTLYIKLPFCPFRILKKLSRYVPEEKLQKKAQRVIKRIKYVGMMESVCIEVDSADGLYLTENFIVTHNSHGAARGAVWFYLCHPNCKVFTAAAPPFDNLKNILWSEIGAVVFDHPEMFKGHTITSLDIRRDSLNFLTGVTIPVSGTKKQRECKFSGKHQQHLLFVIDEGDAVPDEVYSGIESCMSGGTKVRLLIMLNPRQEMGAVWRMQRDHTAHIVHLSSFRHPNVVKGKEIIPGAVDRETTVRRINEWTRPLKSGEKKDKDLVYDLPKFLVGCTAKRRDGTTYPPLIPGQYKIINPAFSYMVLGRYPAAGANQLISREWISSARSRYDIYVIERGEVPPVGVEGIMGLDCAEEGNDSNVAIARYGGYVTAINPGEDEWGGIDTIETGSRGVDWYNNHVNITRANVDATGVGTGVAPHMRRSGCVATGIKVASRPTITTEIGEFRILRDELAWRVREWLRTDRSSMIPPDEELIEELLCMTYETGSGKIEVTKNDDIREILGRSNDKFSALALTFANTEGFFAECELKDYPDEDEEGKGIEN